MQNTSHYSQLATRGSRLVAFILEPVLFLLLWLLFTYVGLFVLKLVFSVYIEVAHEIILGVVVATGLCVVQIILMVNRSQTLGKYLLNLQVVHQNSDKRVGFWRYCFREVVGKTLVIGLLPFVTPGFQRIYTIVDSIFIFRKDKITLHDLMAQTKVICLPAEHRRETLLDFSKL